MQSSAMSESGDRGRGAGRGEGRPPEAENHGVKKRKVRKGTHSCWECRRRKTKCHFDAPSDQICSGCRARGTACTSQEYVDEKPQVRHERRVMERLGRLEYLMEQLVEHVQPLRAAVRGQSPPLSGEGSSAGDMDVGGFGGGEDSTIGPGSVTGIGTPSSGRGASSGPGASRIVHRPISESTSRGEVNTATRPDDARSSSSRSKLDAARQALLAIFPSEPLARLIMSMQPGGQMASSALWSDADIRAGRAEPPRAIASPPPANAHPVFLAKRLLQFAVSLQHSVPGSAQAPLLESAAGTGMGRTPAEMAGEYIAAVQAHVCLDDEMVACGEGLGVLYLYAFCQTNPGNLRRAWLAARRALSLAELMGVGREKRGPGISAFDTIPTLTMSATGTTTARDRSVGPNVSYFWFRLNYLERHLSLVLGLPSSANDRAFHVARAVHMPNHRGQLECAHGLIAGRINDRNHGYHHQATRAAGADEGDSYAFSLSIDRDLEMVAKGMPPGWWAVPELDVSRGGGGGGLVHTWADLILQCQHYLLLILLHLPYLMRDPSRCRWDYSKKMSLSASRQVLTRYSRFRSGGCRLMSCRYMDYAALMAGMSMIMGYLGKGPTMTTGIFGSLREEEEEKTREADRELVGSVRREMGGLGEAKGDKFAKAAGDALGKLIGVWDRGGDGARQEVMDMGVCLQVPYLGTVSICAVPPPEGRGERENGDDDEGIPGRSILAGDGDGGSAGAALGGSWVSVTLDPYLFAGSGRERGGNELGRDITSGTSDAIMMSAEGLDLGSDGDVDMYTGVSGFDGNEADGDGGQGGWMFEQPGLTADENDWVFQGVDTTFWSLLNEGYSQQ